MLSLPEGMLEAVRNSTRDARSGRRHAGVPAGREADPRGSGACSRRPSLRNTEILPLYARLSAQRPGTNLRSGTRASRVVLATNVAETRSRCRASATSSIPGSRASVATACAARCSGCRSSRSRRPAPTSAKGAVAARPRHLHPAVCGGGFRAACGIHAAGSAAHESRERDPADGRAGPWRSGAVSVSRSARYAAGQ